MKLCDIILESIDKSNRFLELKLNIKLAELHWNFSFTLIKAAGWMYIRLTYKYGRHLKR